MADRSSAQKIGARGHRWLAARIEAHPDWLARDLGEDYGIDLEAELTANGVLGQILKIQIKSQASVEHNGDGVKFVIGRKYVDYAAACRYPVVVVLVDTETSEAWYLWLQDWLMRKQAVEGTLKSTQGQWTEWVAATKTIDCGLDLELRLIAGWRGETQLILSLVDAIRSAAALHNHQLIQALTQIVVDNAPSYADASLAALIGEAIKLGDRMRGTIEGIEISNQLFAFVRRLGSRVSRSTIYDLVIRENSYSRAGFAALGILYDDFPDHIRSLNLPTYFLEIEPRVAFYCAFREAFPEEKSVNVFVDPRNFTFANLRYVQPEMFWDKYANRGPSALLDHLEPE